MSTRFTLRVVVDVDEADWRDTYGVEGSVQKDVHAYVKNLLNEDRAADCPLTVHEVIMLKAVSEVR